MPKNTDENNFPLVDLKLLESFFAYTQGRKSPAVLTATPELLSSIQDINTRLEELLQIANHFSIIDFMLAQSLSYLNLESWFNAFLQMLSKVSELMCGTEDFNTDWLIPFCECIFSKLTDENQRQKIYTALSIIDSVLEIEGKQQFLLTSVCSTIRIKPWDICIDRPLQLYEFISDQQYPLLKPYLYLKLVIYHLKKFNTGNQEEIHPNLIKICQALEVLNQTKNYSALYELMFVNPYFIFSSWEIKEMLDEFARFCLSKNLNGNAQFKILSYVHNLFLNLERAHRSPGLQQEEVGRNLYAELEMRTARARIIYHKLESFINILVLFNKKLDNTWIFPARLDTVYNMLKQYRDYTRETELQFNLNQIQVLYTIVNSLTKDEDHIEILSGWYSGFFGTWDKKELSREFCIKYDQIYNKLLNILNRINISSIDSELFKSFLDNVECAEKLYDDCFKEDLSLWQGHKNS